MKKHICLLILVSLLLCGCTAEVTPEEATTLSPVVETQVTEPVGFYDPDSVLEAETNGAVRTYPLNGSNVNGILPLEEDLVVFTETETGTLLTLLSGETLYPGETLQLDFYLTTENSTLRLCDNGFSFFDPQVMETMVLDATLREITRIAAPADLQGTPLLSGDRDTLYYCTPSGIWALDLETGISRVLKEMAFPVQSVTGLWLGDTVLQCSISDNESLRQTMFLSSETGEILHLAEDVLTFTASQENYYAAFVNGSIQSYLYGSAQEEPQALLPQGGSPECYFLSEDHAAVMLHQPEGSDIVLDYYDLENGLRTSSLNLTTEFSPWGFTSYGDGRVCFLNYDENYGCTTLYCWNTTALPSADDTVYTGTHYTIDAPDYDGLAACALYAEEIGNRYGINVLIYEDAVTVQPWDYDMTMEYLVPVIQEELELLDARLANYPEGFLQTLSEQFTSLNICIVRNLTGTAESGSLDAADGIQYWDEYNAYIALSAGEGTEYALYHELCHLIDTVVINESNAYDQWDKLNPKGFAYDYDYIANQSRTDYEYLQEESRYFVDMYSMSFPKEDRARIMEYAMTEGNEHIFQSSAMQAKLKQLCEGIRKAFGLRKSPETFLWEQYLNESLAYTE